MGSDLLETIESACKDATTPSDGTEVGSTTHRFCQSHGISPDGGAIAAMLAAVPSAVDAVLPAGLLLSGPAVSADFASPQDSGAAGPSAGPTRRPSGFQLQREADMLSMLQHNRRIGGDGIEVNSVAAKRRVRPPVGVADKPTLNSQFAVPMLVFRIIDTGTGIETGANGSSNSNELFSAFVTGDVSAEAAQGIEKVHYDDEATGIAKEASGSNLA